MKTIKYFLLFTLGLVVLTSCNSNDDGFYNTVYLHSTNLLDIETQASYSVGEKLYITADFSRYQNETGQTEALDIYKTTGGAAIFNFSYVLERKINATDWELVEIPTNQLDIVTGNAISGSFVYGSCIYNTADQSYEYNVGLPLSQTGEYRLSFGYNSSSNEIELISDSNDLNLYMTLFTTINNLDTDNYYTFTVN